MLNDLRLDSVRLNVALEKASELNKLTNTVYQTDNKLLNTRATFDGTVDKSPHKRKMLRNDKLDSPKLDTIKIVNTHKLESQTHRGDSHQVESQHVDSHRSDSQHVDTHRSDSQHVDSHHVEVINHRLDKLEPLGMSGTLSLTKSHELMTNPIPDTNTQHAHIKVIDPMKSPIQGQSQSRPTKLTSLSSLPISTLSSTTTPNSQTHKEVAKKKIIASTPRTARRKFSELNNSFFITI